MANAADYLQLSQTQIVVPYKLRTRSISGATFTATNIASNYTLTAEVSSNLEGAVVTPSTIRLGPNESIQLTVTFQTAPLETRPVGVINSSLSFVVNASPVFIPIPPPPPPPPPPPAPPSVYGCTDSSALNYSPSATTDNGTCIPKIYGCTNINALNFNPRANVDDGNCVFTPQVTTILGCTNRNAKNYNPLATQDDGSCIVTNIGCMDRRAVNYDPLANTPCENSCCRYQIDNPPVGCTDPNAKNYDRTANIDNGSCIQYKVGCTNPAAFNYDSTAEKDDGTCQFTGCKDPLANNYVQGADIVACVNNACCTYDKKIDTCLQIGKITSTSTIAANQNLGPGYANVCRLIQDTIVGGCRESCTDEFVGITNVGCTDRQAINYNPDATQNDNSCIYVTGCMDSSATNYNPRATRSSDNCTYTPACVPEQTISCAPIGIGSPQEYIRTYYIDSSCNVGYCATLDCNACTNTFSGRTDPDSVRRRRVEDETVGDGGSQGICGECRQDSDCFFNADGSFNPTRICDQTTFCCRNGQVFAE